MQVKDCYIVTKQLRSKQDTNKEYYYHKSKSKHQRRYQRQSTDESPLQIGSPMNPKLKQHTE